ITTNPIQSFHPFPTRRSSDLLLPAAKPHNSSQGAQEIHSSPQSASQNQTAPPPNLETSGDWNHRLKELLDSNPSTPAMNAQEYRSEEHTSELQSRSDLVCRLL